MPFTWTCNNSALLIAECSSGKEVKNIPICIPRWRHGSLVLSTPRLLLSAGAAQAPAFCHQGSCAFLGTWWCPRCQSHWESAWQRGGGGYSFSRGQGGSNPSENWVLRCLELVSPSHDPHYVGGAHLTAPWIPALSAGEQGIINLWGHSLLFLGAAGVCGCSVSISVLWPSSR